MTDREALIRSICEAPQDATLRLIFADWLEERGEVDYPAFIRVQCELARLDGRCRRKDGISEWCIVDGDALAHHPGCPAEALRCRERELLDKIPANSTQPNKFLWLGKAVQEACIFGRASPEQVAAGLEFRRGFVESVSCTLSDWIGGECSYCQGTGDGGPSLKCPRCRGTGRENAHGPQIVLAQPVTTVRVTDREPSNATTPGRWYWRRGDSGPDGLPMAHDLPPEVWPESDARWFAVFDSPAEAHAWLSQRLIRWARQRAGLPELEAVCPGRK